MATIKITEKAVANELKSDAYFLVTQTENGVVSLRRVPLAVVMAGVEGIIAAPYSTTAHYEPGDYCINLGQLWQNKTAISSGEAWNANHWTVVTVGELLDTEAFDLNIAYGLLLNHIRQNEDDWAEKGFVSQHGTKTLTNTQTYPFNDSETTVALSQSLPDTTYAVIPQIVSSAGNAGEIKVSDKLVNGFKLAYTGSASSVVLDYIVIGGFTA